MNAGGPALPRRRDGFALPLALAVMVATAILSVTSLQVALVDFQANRGARLSTRALFAAEAGAQRTLATWATGPWSALTPGDSASTGWASLPDGSRYRSVVLRVDDGSTGTPLFRVLTEGRPSRTATARRQVLTMITGGAAESLCCEGAAVVAGRLLARGESSGGGRGRGRVATPPPTVDGRDFIPSAWAGTCPTATSALPGVVVSRSRDVILRRNAEVEGSPPIREDRGLGPSVAEVLGGTAYDDLAARADVILPPGARFRSAIGPQASQGECATSASGNWGAPETPGSVCWNYLPIIHARGDLRIDRGGRGQGILLVDGDLTVRDGFRFYGIVVVKGKTTWRDGSTLTGGIVIGGGSRGNQQSQLRDAARFRYSSCAVARASADLGGTRFLDGRHWFEIP